MRKALFAAAVAALASTSAARAVELVAFTTVRNTDVAAFGIGQLRDAGTGTLTVSGLTGAVSSAYLYWAGPTNSPDPLANASVSFGGSNILGANIGFSDDNAWGQLNSQAYRADVTSIVAGNGAYALAGFDKPLADINGASLIVFHDDGNAANNRDVFLFNGNDANFESIYDALGWNASMPGIPYAGGSASLTLHVSDGQGAGDGTLALNGTTLASGAIFSGNGVQLGNGTDFDALWDIETFDITSFLSPGANNLSLTLVTPSGDNVALIVSQLSLPAAPLDPGGPIPEPSTWAMMLLGFGALGALVRRRRAPASIVTA